MPKFEVNAPDGKKYQVNAPEGATEQDAISYVQKEFYSGTKVDMPVPEKGFGQKVQEGIDYLPRALGLSARSVLQGGGDIADFLSSPIRAGLNAAGMNIQGRTGESIANAIGLPKDETTAEKVGVKGAELMLGAALPMDVASRAKAVTPWVQGAIKQFAANPVSQLSSAAGAGAAGEYAKETGGGTGAQIASALAGGLVAPMVTGAIGSAAGATKRMVSNFAKPDVVQAKIDITINNALKDSGYNLADVPLAIRNQLRSDVSGFVTSGADLNPDALRRLIDYRLVGANPLKGNLTLNPADITRQKNLGKIGMNSQDENLQMIGMNENANNKVLIGGLNELGANTADDSISAAQKIIGALQAKNDVAKGVIGNLYDKARATGGRSASLDHVTFTNQANNLLDDALLGGKLPSDVRNLLNKTAQGEMPLTVDVAEQFKTRIGALQRASTDPAERLALGKVREALDNTPLLEGQGQQAIDAFNRARKVNAAWMKIVDKNPALQAVRDGVEPDKFVQTYIIGNGSKSNMMDVSQLKNLIGKNKEAQSAVRGQITSFLKSKALNGASDEVGNFSQSAYNKALDAIGDRKLNLFFTKQEVDQMKAIGRVASYEQVQPKGSAVNNSNTAGAAIGSLLDSLSQSPLLRKIPFGAELIGNPASSISTSLQAGQVINPSTALAAQKLKQPFALPASAILASGGLLAP